MKETGIYELEYFYMCGCYRAVIIAYDEHAAVSMFLDDFSGYPDGPNRKHTRVTKLGHSTLEPRTVVSEDNF